MTGPQAGSKGPLRTAYMWTKCNPEKRLGVVSWLLTCRLLSLNCVQHSLSVSLQEVLLLWWLNLPESSIFSLSVAERLPCGVKIGHVTNQVIVASQDLSTVSLEGTSAVF